MATATKINLTPLKDHIIVKRTEAQTKTTGGIFLPEGAKEKPKEGTIIAVGPGRFNDKGERVALQVKNGDHVIFSSYAGNEVKVAGEDYMIMTEDDVLAIIG